MKDYIIIASNSRAIADMFSYLLDEAGNKHETFFANNAKEVKRCIKQRRPRLVFVDADMCALTTEYLVSEIAAYDEELRIAVFSHAEPNDYRIGHFIHCGAESFINCRVDCAKLHVIVQNVLSGKTFVPSGVYEALERYEYSDVNKIKISPALLRTALHIAAGYETRAISERLDCTENYIRKQRFSLYRITGARNPVELARWLLAQNLMTAEQFCRKTINNNSINNNLMEEKNVYQNRRKKLCRALAC
jgi:DNA-binding NarL/FixJ family response regulator